MRIISLIVLCKVVTSIVLAEAPAKSNNSSTASNLSTLPTAGSVQRGEMRSLRTADTAAEKSKEERVPNAPLRMNPITAEKSKDLIRLGVKNDKTTKSIQALRNSKRKTDQDIADTFEKFIEGWIRHSKKYRLAGRSDKEIFELMQLQFGYSNDVRERLLKYIQLSVGHTHHEIKATVRKYVEQGLSPSEIKRLLWIEYAYVSSRVKRYITQQYSNILKEEKQLAHIGKAAHATDRSVNADEKDPIRLQFNVWLRRHVHPSKLHTEWKAAFGTTDNLSVDYFAEYWGLYNESRTDLEQSLKTWAEYHVDPERILVLLGLQGLDEARRKMHPNYELYLGYKKLWDREQQIRELKKKLEDNAGSFRFAQKGVANFGTLDSLPTNEDLELIKIDESNLLEVLKECLELNVHPDSIFESLILMEGLDKVILENHLNYKIYLWYKQQWENEQQIQLQLQTWLKDYVSPDTLAAKWKAAFGTVDNMQDKYVKQYEELYKKANANMEQQLQMCMQTGIDPESIAVLWNQRGLDVARLKSHWKYKLYTQQWNKKNKA